MTRPVMALENPAEERNGVAASVLAPESSAANRPETAKRAVQARPRMRSGERDMGRAARIAPTTLYVGIFTSEVRCF